MGRIKKSKLLKNGLWLFVLQVFNTVVPMVTIPYITRVLGTAGYGAFSLAQNWILYFQVIVEYGFGFWGARRIAVSGKECLQNTFSTIITSRLVLMGLSAAVMCIVYMLSGKEIGHYICMSILFSMVVGAAFQLTWLFQGMQDMKYITVINALSRLISVLLTFLMVRKPSDVYLYCFLYSCTYLFSAVIGLWVARRKYLLKIRLCKFSDILVGLKDAWPLFISQAMSKVLSGFGVTILGMVAANSTVGIYSAMYKIPYAMALLFAPISQAIYPDISVAFGESQKVGIGRVKKIAGWIVPAFLSASVLIMMFNRPLVEIMFGNAYASSSFILIPLVAWFVVSVINNFLGIQLLTGSGHQKEYSNAFLISGFFSVVLNIVFGKLFGMSGIACATLVSEIIMSGLLLYQVKRVFVKGNAT